MEPNPYKAPANAAIGQHKQGKSPPPAATIATVLAGAFAAVWLVQILDYYRGGHSGDQLIKLGIAGLAVCLAVPLACIALSVLAWERYSQKSVSYVSAALALVNLAIVACLFVYCF